MKASTCRGCSTPTVTNPDRLCTQCRLDNDAGMRAATEARLEAEDWAIERERGLPDWEDL